MQILIDMNLSPQWKEVFQRAGYNSLHWMEVGAQNALDSTILHWAKDQDRVVFTHDLDFGAILAATGFAGPIVIQLRSEDTRSDTMGGIVVNCLRICQSDLKRGALVTIHTERMKVTTLPLRN